jgi:1,4-alpha-glucan branching enzyme
MRQHQSPFINSRKKTIEFYIHHDCATRIALSGSFNHWSRHGLTLRQGKNGVWKIKIPMLPKGKYYYKFFIDERMWVEDVDNPNREPDGIRGWNSILDVVE